MSPPEFVNTKPFPPNEVALSPRSGGLPRPRAQEGREHAKHQAPAAKPMRKPAP